MQHQPTLGIAIAGLSGRMGKALIEALEAYDPNTVYLAAGFVSNHSPWKGKKISELLNKEIKNDISISTEAEFLLHPFDLMIDVTPAGSQLHYGSLCKKYKKPLVLATTGFTSILKEKLQKLSKEIPVLHAANFSFGMSFILSILERHCAPLKNLGPIAITETHHTEKRDTPSGTALEMASTIKSAFNLPEAPPIASVRIPNVVGDHQITFTLEHDAITLSHTVINRRVFAEGALKGALWLRQQPSAGLYSMHDVLGV